MSGSSAKFWLSVCIFAFVVAVLLLIAVRGQRPGMSVEPVQTMNSEVISQMESLTARVQEMTTRVQELTVEFEGLNRSLRQQSLGVADQKQLADRINQLSLAQSNTWLVVQGLSSHFPELTESPEQLEQGHQKNMSLLGDILKEQETVVETANRKLQEMSSGVPAEVRTLDTDSGLKDPTLEQYWPFFKAKAHYSAMARLRSLLELKLAQEQVDAGSGK